MITKTVDVEVVHSTFPGNKAPGFLRGGSGVSIDVGAALLMLGTVTTPGGYSAASPASHWAWIRYYGAVAVSSDLRVTTPFVDLDPHQKTILSDDFGVAFATIWMHDRLGGFMDIMDGRRFLIQYASLVHRPPRQRLRKVGPTKCPDYVIQDYRGRWHVLECKGTQSSLNYRDWQMGANALQQKRGIRVTGSVKGERLVSGLYIGSELSPDSSHLRVIDPPTDALIEFPESREAEAAVAARRLSVGRAFGLAGLYGAAEEIAVPLERDARVAGLYRTGEAKRAKQSLGDRMASVARELKQPTQARFANQGDEFVGREIDVEIPGDSIRQNTGFSRMAIQLGVNAEIIEEARDRGGKLFDEIDGIAERFLPKNIGVTYESTGNKSIVRNGRLFVATIEFH